LERIYKNITAEKIENISINAIHKKFKNYELEIQKIEIKNNNIIGEIEINSEDINKNISIINSFENAQRNYGFGYEREYKNEKEIKESVKIKINGKNIDDFSYVHIFDKIGKYKIEYLFKKQLKKTNHLFYKCVNIVSLNLMNFNIIEAFCFKINDRKRNTIVVNIIRKMKFISI